MKRNKSWVNNLIVRIISVFMTIVLMVASLPITAKAEAMTYYICRFNNYETEEDINHLVDKFYVYDIDNDCIYNFVPVHKVEGEYYSAWMPEEDFWFIRADVPKGGNYIMYSINGVKCCVNENFNGFVTGLFLNTIDAYDGEQLIDTVYAYRMQDSITVTEDMIKVPTKLGYVFDGWLDMDGEKVVFPIELYRNSQWDRMWRMSIYAKWSEHIHDWDEENVKYDDTHHWCECIGEGTCDIIDDAEKYGYELHQMGEWSGKKAATLDEKGLEVRKCTGCDYEEERETEKLTNITIGLINYSGEGQLDDIAPLFYVTNVSTGMETQFKVFQGQNGKWYMNAEVARNTPLVLQTKQGVILDKIDGLTGGAGYNQYLYTVCYNDGDTKLDEIYTWFKQSYGLVNEDLVEKPEKLGYECIGWTSADGDIVNFPVCVERTEGWQNYKLNVYAKWTEHEHDFGDEWEKNEEFHYHVCVECGKHQEDILHEMGRWVEVTAPKFKEDGLEERKCTVCDYTQQRAIPKLADSHVHDYTGVEDIVDEPSCTKEGLKKIYCSEVECGAYIEGSIDKEAHDFDDEWEYNDEVHYHECKVCKSHDNDILHEMGEWVEVNGATFDEDGLEERKCTICDYKEDRRIPKRSESHVHDYSGEEFVVDVASCTKEGLKKVYCSEPECGEYIEEPIARLAHEYKTEWEYDEAKHYHSCQKCGIHDEDISHIMGQWEEVVPAKFREDGKAVRKCETCEYREEKVLHKLEDSHVHDYSGNEEIIKSATCIENGLKKVYCTEGECGAYLEVAVVDGEHVFGAQWEYDGQAHYRICDLCGERSDVHKHNLGEGVVVKVATEDEDGIMEWSCEDCAYVLQEAIKYVKPEVPKKDEEASKPNPEVVPDTPVIKDEPVKEEAPYTGDIVPVKMYATLAMIAGFTYVLAMFVGDKLGMSEEKKEDIVGKLVAFGKGKNRFVKAIAIAAIFVVLAYYHAIGKNCCRAEELIKEM